MKFNFLLKFDALFEYSAPAYDDRQISQLLTQAQNRIFLDTYYAPTNKIQRGFEADEKRRRDLEQLIKQDAWGIDNTEILTNGEFTGNATGWTLGAGWAYSGNGVVGTTSSGDIFQLKSFNGLRVHKVTVIVSGITTGTVTPQIRDIVGTPISTNGTHTQYITVYGEGATNFSLFGANFTGKVESYSVKAAVSLGQLTPSSDQLGVHPNGVFFDLPSDFLYSIEEAAMLAGGTKEVIVKPIKHDSYIANINNPYKQPCSWLVWRMDYSRATDAIGTSSATAKRTELIHDGTGLTAYRMRYLRFPPEITVNEYDPTQQRHCVLDMTMHESIVSEAVKIAQAAVNPQEYQISAAESEAGKK